MKIIDYFKKLVLKDGTYIDQFGNKQTVTYERLKVLDVVVDEYGNWRVYVSYT